MIDKPSAIPAAAPAPGAFSPLVRAVIDSVSEGIVVFDAQGRLLYANATARRAIDGPNGDVRHRLQTLGARDARLFANAAYPLVRTRGCVPGLARLSALESSRIHVFPAAEE